MDYDLLLPREDFDKADRLVRATLLGPRFLVPIARRMTSDSESLQPENKAYVETNPGCTGICFGHEPYFDVWISPAYKNTNTDWYKDTLLHELVHGYLRAYTHDARWKRFFGRVLHHYNTFVQPINADNLTATMLKRYTRQRADESPEQYGLRLEMEQDTIAKVAVDERPYIEKAYDQLGLKETRG